MNIIFGAGKNTVSYDVRCVFGAAVISAFNANERFVLHGDLYVYIYIYTNIMYLRVLHSKNAYQTVGRLCRTSRDDDKKQTYRFRLLAIRSSDTPPYREIKIYSNYYRNTHDPSATIVLILFYDDNVVRSPRTDFNQVPRVTASRTRALSSVIVGIGFTYNNDNGFFFFLLFHRVTWTSCFAGGGGGDDFKFAPRA